MTCSLFATLASAGSAQGLADAIAKAEARIDARQWREALELLLPLVEATEPADQSHGVATKLDEVGEGLKQAGDQENALRARRAALGMRKRLLADGDHPDVVNSLNNVASGLESLGRVGEALPQYEAALAMTQRLFANRDHPDVAGSLNNVALCLESLGRIGEALARHEEVLAMTRRLVGDRDHPEVATCLNNVAVCLRSLGRTREALPRLEAVLAMRRRLFGDRDHPDIATSLNNLAACLELFGNSREALPQFEAALAMRKRLFENRDHPEIAANLNNLASCLLSLGRGDEALAQHETALAMRQRLARNRDHPAVATSLNNLASCLSSLGRTGEALARHEAALAMRQRLFADRDHPHVATSLNNVAADLQSLGRSSEALPRYEAALAMRRRLARDRDTPEVATSLNSMASCLRSLGRAGEALPQYEAGLAIRQRLFGDRDHPDLASSLNGVAACLKSLGRAAEALPRYEAALAMRKRLAGDTDHVDVATSLNNLASCLASLGRAGDALPLFEQALAMRKRLFGDRDHPHVATSMINVALRLEVLGHAKEALPRYEAALAMFRRLFGDRDHPYVAEALSHVAYCLQALGRDHDALTPCAQSCDLIERLREQSLTSPDLKQSFFDDLKRSGAFELMQRLELRHDASAALHAAERSRGRDLLDLWQQQHFDPLAEAIRRAQQQGNAAATERLTELQTELIAAALDGDRLLHQLAKLDDSTGTGDDAGRRAMLLAESNDAAARQRRLLDERARLLADALPGGNVRTTAEIQSELRAGELLLEFTIAEQIALLYVLGPDGAVGVVELPTAHATTQRLLPGLLQRSSQSQLRGRDPDASMPQDIIASSRELFTSLFPGAVWERIRSSKRVFIAAHRSLHRLPFELLVTADRDNKPVPWLEDGPPISYVPSGSALHWLRTRTPEGGNGAPSLDILAIGDPSLAEAAPPLPERGVLVRQVDAGGQAERVGLRPFDVLVAYDGQQLADDVALRDARAAVEAAIKLGTRNDAAAVLEVWRGGEILRVEVQPGPLGMQAGRGAARGAFEATLAPGDLAHHADLERLRRLRQLDGARAEAAAIVDSFRARAAAAELLLGPQAMETAVFDLASRAKYLHFACHGIAEEYAGQSLSMLVLSQVSNVRPEEDGFLKLDDLLHRWRGRLSACRLVVLSACHTNVGPTLRDNAPQALPIGFLFAGVPSVISSLWAVDDASTRELMTNFYSRLLAGETDQLAAFTAAKKALRKKYPDPFHWAPFLYIGSPE